MATTWWFRQKRGVPSPSIDERFTDMADIVSEAAGRWRTFAVCLVLFFIWLGAGPSMGWSDTWQLIANTPTTWAELALGLFTLAAANRVEKRNSESQNLHLELSQKMATIVEQTAAMIEHSTAMLARIESLETKEIAVISELSDFEHQHHHDDTT